MSDTGLFTDAALGAAVTPLHANIDDVSLHTDDPSTTGANEVSGGSYARQTPSWNAVVNNRFTLSAAVSFTVPAGTTVKYVGLWDGSTFYGRIPVTHREFVTEDTFVIGSMVIAAVNNL